MIGSIAETTQRPVQQRPARGRMRRWPALVCMAAFSTLLASCAGGASGTEASTEASGGTGTGGASSNDSGAASSGGPSGEIVVFAAASLTEAFTQIARDFEAKYPDATVVTQFAGSITLATQLTRGAPADVYASANTAQMQRVVNAGLTKGEPTVFVTNTLQIVVPQGNPAGVQGLRAFSKEKLEIALCAPKVPCGALAQEVFDIAGVEPAADTLEQDVKAVLTKVRLGEVDAGLVYRTDVASAEAPVVGIAFPAASKAANQYPIAVLGDAQNPSGAAAFVHYVLSPAGQQVLASFGFVTQTA